MEIVNIILSCSSIILSIIAFCFSLRSQNLQNKANELEIQIKQEEIAKMATQKELMKSIKIESKVIHISRNNYRLKVYNIGENTAYNITVKIIQGKNIALLDNGIIPYEILEPKSSIELPIVYSLESTRKFKVLITWFDKEGKKNSNEQLLYLN